MRVIFLCLCLLFLGIHFSSCWKEDLSDIPTTDGTVDFGAYHFKIEGGPCESVIFDGDMVENTDWDPDTRFIYLENDPDYDSKQIMTMYIYFYVQSGEDPSKRYWVNPDNPLVKLATTCIAFGPGDIAKPRLYRPRDDEFIDSLTIGSNFIAGKVVNWTYDRVLVYPEDEPETVTINGHFVAKMR